MDSARQTKRANSCECQARIIRHEFQAAHDRRSLLKFCEIVESQQEEIHYARAEEVQQRDQQLLPGQLLQQKLELREARQRSLTEMEEVRMLQSSTFDTFARRGSEHNIGTFWLNTGIAK